MHSQLKQYLNSVEQGLKDLPAEKRQNELRELQAHLEEMAQAQQEQGVSESEAYRTAIQQFGTSEDISQELVVVQRAGWRAWGETALYAYGALAIVYCLGFVLSTCVRAFLPVSPAPPGAIIAPDPYHIPFLLEGMALGYLLYRNGWRRVWTTIRRADSSAAIAAIWTLMVRLVNLVSATIITSSAFAGIARWWESHVFHTGDAYPYLQWTMPVGFVGVFLSGIVIGKLARTTLSTSAILRSLAAAIGVLYVITFLENTIRFFFHAYLQGASLSVFLFDSIVLNSLYLIPAILALVFGVIVARPQRKNPLRRVRA